MARGGVRILFNSRDRILDRFHNQLAAVGEKKARVAMARAINRAGDSVNGKVRRALQKQTSIPKRIIDGQMRVKRAAQKGGGALEYIISGTGSEIPLGEFNPRQFKFGVRARVWGRMQRYPGMFGAPGDTPALVAKLGGQVFHRSGASRYPIEKGYGPSVPKEMVKNEARVAFEQGVEEVLVARLEHELARMLPS